MNFLYQLLYSCGVMMCIWKGVLSSICFAISTLSFILLFVLLASLVIMRRSMSLSGFAVPLMVLPKRITLALGSYCLVMVLIFLA